MKLEDLQILQATGIEKDIIRDIADRQQKGILKYGTTVAENPLKLEEWLQHLYEELLDAAVYTKRTIKELKENGSRN